MQPKSNICKILFRQKSNNTQDDVNSGSQVPREVDQATKIKVLIAAILLLTASLGPVLADSGFYQGPGVTAAEILRGRGYIADELFVETSTGYVLRVTRGRNPLIDGGHLASKDPISFLHGILGSANNFLLNSFGVRPKDFTNISLVSMDLDALQERLADEPSARSLPLLALNCGHEVWLLDRRGVPGSQQLIGDPKSIKATPSSENTSFVGNIMNYLSNMFSGPLFARQVVFTLDRKFWNFSLDEQASVDFPETIQFILDNSSWASRVPVVGHSAGGAMALMGLSLYPNELTSKISSCILWSPAYATSNDNPIFTLLFSPQLPIPESITGPLPPPFLTIPVQTAFMLICSPPPTWTTLCEGLFDLIMGQSGRQQPTTPQLLSGLPYSASAHELAQLGQTIRYPNHTIHAFDFRQDNQAIYGQPTPPVYDLSSLRNFSSMSFYVGATDRLVTPADVERTRAQLRVPSIYHMINTTFNHLGYFAHVDAQRLAVIPTMLEIESLARSVQ